MNNKLKIRTLILAGAMMTATMTGCQKEEVLQTELQSAASKQDNAPASTFGVATITSITGRSLGVGTYRNYLAADFDGLDEFVINGSNFGNTQGNGTVRLNNLSSYAIVNIVRWSNTQIRVRVRSGINSVAAPSAENGNVSPSFTVRNSAGSSATRSFNVAPSITGKAFLQCTWYANKARLEVGKSIQGRGQSYSNYSGSINADYVPQDHDIMIWDEQTYGGVGKGHQAFIDKVSTTTSNWAANKRTVTYVLDIRFTFC